MARCSACATKMSFSESNIALSFGGKCKECLNVNQEELDTTIDAIMLTTETAPNINITKRIEIVTAECAFGMNIFKDLFAGVRDIVALPVHDSLIVPHSKAVIAHDILKETFEKRFGVNFVIKGL